MTLDCTHWPSSGHLTVPEPVLWPAEQPGSWPSRPWSQRCVSPHDGSLRCPLSQRGGVKEELVLPGPRVMEWLLAELPGPPPGGPPWLGRGARKWLPRYATAVGPRGPPPGCPLLLLHCKAASAGGLQLELIAWHCHCVTLEESPHLSELPSPRLRSGQQCRSPRGGSESDERMVPMGASHGAGQRISTRLLLSV